MKHIKNQNRYLKPGIDPTIWGVVKRFKWAILISIAMWGLILKGILMAINY